MYCLAEVVGSDTRNAVLSWEAQAPKCGRGPKAGSETKGVDRRKPWTSMIFRIFKVPRRYSNFHLDRAVKSVSEGGGRSSITCDHVRKARAVRGCGEWERFSGSKHIALAAQQCLLHTQAPKVALSMPRPNTVHTPRRKRTPDHCTQAACQPLGI